MVENITASLQSQASQAASDIVNQTLSIFLGILKPFINVALVIALIIVSYWLLRIILLWLQNRKIKKTYKNTNLILEKLDKLEEKINRLEKHKDKKK